MFTSGQGPIDPLTNQVLQGTTEEQTRLTLSNLKTIIEAAGFSMENVLKVTAFLEDMSDFPTFNEVYKEFFASSKPARACIQAGKLPPGWKVEVEAIIGKGG